MGYIAKVDIWYPADPDVVRRLQDGENIPMRQRRMKHVKAGERCDDIPLSSVPGFLAKGKIEAAVEAKLTGRARRTEVTLG